MKDPYSSHRKTDPFYVPGRCSVWEYDWKQQLMETCAEATVLGRGYRQLDIGKIAGIANHVLELESMLDVFLQEIVKHIAVVLSQQGFDIRGVDNYQEALRAAVEDMCTRYQIGVSAELIDNVANRLFTLLKEKENAAVRGD